LLLVEVTVLTGEVATVGYVNASYGVRRRTK